MLKNTLANIRRNEKWIKRGTDLFVFLLATHNLWPLVSTITHANKVELVMQQSGEYALIWLLLTLSLTPLRRWATIICQFWQLSYGKRLADWNFLIRYRRKFGLASALFSLIHLGLYLWLEMDFIWQEVFWDIKHRYFIQFGWISFVIMMILAITSPQFAQRKLRRKWRPIHRSIYLLGLMVIVHFALSVKPGDLTYIPWLGILVLLLAHRCFFALKNDGKSKADNGMEAEREYTPFK